MIEQADEAKLDSFQSRVAEHGRARAILESFAYIKPFVGEFLKAFHYWSAQGFFFFALLHLFRVWATGSYRGRRIVNWWIGLCIFMLAMGENLFGLLARGDWESQFVSMHSDDMLFIQPFFFNLFSPANFTADLTIHIAVLPIIIFGLFLAHVMLVRIMGLSKPLSNQKKEE
jgi:quinol-cytochrome oxidoreductase complex cytochrome b subunit